MLKLNRQGLLFNALMLASLVAVVAGPFHRFKPEWQPAYLVAASFVVAVEAGLVHHAFRREHMWLDELARYLVPEVFVMLIVMRVATTLGIGAATLAADARRWLLDPLGVFDAPFVAAILVGLLVGLIAHSAMRDLFELEPRESETPAAMSEDSLITVVIARQDRSAALGQIGSRFVFGGVVLLLALGVEVVNLRRVAGPSLPLSPLSAGASLIYVASGFLLYSQARLALLRARWRMEGARVDPSVARRWTRVSWLIVGGIVGLAALLPRSYGLGLLATLQQSLALLGYAIAILGYLITSILSLLAILPVLLIALLTGGRLDSERAAPLAPMTPPPAVPPATFEPNLLAALVFWLCMLLLAAYAIWTILQRNPAIGRALASRGPLAWLLSRLGWLWRDTRSWAGQATERARALLRRRAPIARATTSALLLSRLAPRDLVRYFYRSTLRRAATGGMPRRAGQTPYEYRATLAQRLPDAEQDIAELTESFVVAEYSPRPVGPDDARRARGPWERMRRRLRELSSGDQAAGRQDDTVTR
ncbi:MAG TPA: DUF4129 domain-containing protein [Roseiflexaceae bacterium]